MVKLLCFPEGSLTVTAKLRLQNQFIYGDMFFPLRVIPLPFLRWHLFGQDPAETLPLKKALCPLLRGAGKEKREVQPYSLGNHLGNQSPADALALETGN